MNPFLPTMLAMAALSASTPLPNLGLQSRRRPRRELTSEEELKLREEREARRERLRLEHEARVQAEIARIEAYDKGIDPTNGQPLSRQQRRRIRTHGVPRK